MSTPRTFSEQLSDLAERLDADGYPTALIARAATRNKAMEDEIVRQNSELQAKDREIERLREVLEQVSYQPGSDKFASIEYCFFCSYSRDWIAKNGHGNTCPLHQEKTT